MIIGEVERVRKRISIVLVAVMVLELVGCGKDSEVDSAEAKQIQVDEEISAGLAYEGRMDLEYATEYAVDYYSDDYDLITISDGSRFLIVPEDKEIPERIYGNRAGRMVSARDSTADGTGRYYICR